MGIAQLTPNSPGTAGGPIMPAAGAGRDAIVRTTITPSPGAAPDAAPKRSLRDRLHRSSTPDQHPSLTTARQPYPGPSVLRIVMATLLSALCLITLGGAILVLLLWRQEREASVLASQYDRVWTSFDRLIEIERILAFLVVPIATVWIAVATVNVRRATGHKRNPAVAALSLPVGAIGAWFIGDRLVADAEGLTATFAGIALQVVFLAIPLLFLERVVEAAEARHRPLRATFVIAAAYVIHLQTLNGLSTTEATRDVAEWGGLAANLVISTLLLALGALSANEAARAVEEGTAHRYELRHKFGESLLAQVQR